MTLTADVRKAHVLRGHTPTNMPQYCAESDGRSAVYCEVGLLLREISRLEGLVMVYAPVYENVAKNGEPIRRALAAKP